MVIGVIALLLSILIPPLRFAHRQAMSTRCAAQLQQMGVALDSTRNDYKFYPLWDDAGSPKRYTWIDVLVQRGYLAACDVGYCPEDPRPAPLNAARALKDNLVYPGAANQAGIDYSYGIGMPLSAAGWAWQPVPGSPDTRPRRLADYDRYPAQRILAADGSWSVVYNFSADAMYYHAWNFPTQFDNTLDWRHPNITANLLFQDGHVMTRLRYVADAAEPVNTSRCFFWYPGEPVHVGPPDQSQGNYYPNQPPADLKTGQPYGSFPPDMAPGYYTTRLLWTKIFHK